MKLLNNTLKKTKYSIYFDTYFERGRNNRLDRICLKYYKI